MAPVAPADLNGSALYDRIARLTIVTATGSFSDTDPTQNALVITGGVNAGEVGLRFTFKIEKTNQKAPNTFEIGVYNLAPSTRAQLKQKGARVILEAGYARGGYQGLCVGDVRTVDHLREGPDWKTVLKGGDGERSIRYARAGNSFASGCTVGQVVEYCAGAMGLSLGNTDTQAAKMAKVLQHGYTVHGFASTELDKILRSVNYTYSIQDGVIQILAPGESLAQTIPFLTSDTGLLGSPEFATPETKGKPQAIKYRALLMPASRPGGRNRVKSERLDGILRTNKVTHDGDTGGGNWYSEFDAVNDPSASAA